VCAVERAVERHTRRLLAISTLLTNDFIMLVVSTLLLMLLHLVARHDCLCTVYIDQAITDVNILLVMKNSPL